MTAFRSSLSQGRGLLLHSAKLELQVDSLARHASARTHHPVGPSVEGHGAFRTSETWAWKGSGAGIALHSRRPLAGPS